MVKARMEGRRIPNETIQKMKEGMDFDRVAYRKENSKNTPTMQTGYNEDLTIREEEIKPFVYELESEDDKR